LPVVRVLAAVEEITQSALEAAAQAGRAELPSRCYMFTRSFLAGPKVPNYGGTAPR
jgi:hypothetical protein